MVSFLLDTNVLSEPSRLRPDQRVMGWLAATAITSRYISALSMGELTKGLAISLERDRARAETYQLWLIKIREQYRGRVLSIDSAVAETWGVMASNGSFPIVDALLISTARMGGFTVATRNTRDFANRGVALFNPWTD